MPSAKRDNFTSSYPVLVPFISFSFLIILARTYSTMLKGESGHLCLVPAHRGKSFNLSPCSMLLAVGLSYMPWFLRYISLCLIKNFDH